MQTEINSIRSYGYIYTVTNKFNGKQYVGQTIDELEHRWYYYKTLRCKCQIKLLNALKKYGPENFNYEMLDTAPDQIVLDYLEDFYIECLDTRKNGYNCRGGGSRGKLSEEHKHKISLWSRNRKHSIETKHKMSLSQLGKTHTKETKQKMSIIAKNRSKEHIQKISNTLLGRKLTEEHKQKISKSNKGKTAWNKGLSRQKNV